MNKEQQRKLLNIILLFVILQPIFDIISFLSIRNIIPINISTYIKPLFVFFIGTYMFIKYNNHKKAWLTYVIIFGLFLIGHFYILYKLFTPTSVLLHEFRFILNIIYMLFLFNYMLTLYNHYDDKNELLEKLKKTIIITFAIYLIMFLLAVLTNTSALTYEYSDGNKLGYKGWLDSGQIFGHAISIMFPIIMYTILRPKQKWYIKICYLAMIILVVSLLGTKVPYYIVTIVLTLYIIISIFIKVFNKEFRKNYFNIFLAFIGILLIFLTYKYTPVAYNTDLNRKNANVDIDFYDMDDESGNVKSLDEIIKEHKDSNVSRLVQYKNWNTEASNYLVKLFKSGKVHPTDMRKKQFYYSKKKFEIATIEYKLFGIGFLNQDATLSLESDFLMALFCFGILGFIVMLLIPILEMIKSTIFIIRNIKKIDLEAYLLYMGLGIFFCISIYAGYTYIYTNFSIFLVMLIIMLKSKINIIQCDIKSKKEIKKIDFLLLHLGYGGIESATINSANALAEDYNVSIISFYKLQNDQSNKLNSNIDIKYLYNGSPNREEFKKALKEYKITKVLFEGIKSVSILLKKKYLIIKYILTTKSDAIVSTRVDFSLLLNKYGKYETLKIAQEHHYHNDDKKYISKLRKYDRIDYLCALTKALENDYKKILIKNNHIKVVLLPNMITTIPKEKSSLNEKNIITISRLDYGKRNDEIIKAFSNLKEKDWKLYIVGDGKEYNNLSNFINELKLEDRVILTGYKDKKEIEKYMLKSSIFLMASISEGLPMVLLEAMSYGIPCIAYETASGTTDIIENGKNGYIIKDRNEKKYVEKIEQLIQNDKQRKEFGKYAKQSVNKFSKNEVIKIWKKILKEGE